MKPKTFEQLLTEQLLDAMAGKREQKHHTTNDQAAVDEETYEVELEMDGIIIRTDVEHLGELLNLMNTFNASQGK